MVTSEAQPARDPRYPARTPRRDVPFSLALTPHYIYDHICRFSEISGKLNPDIFLKSYEFLDQYQEDEVKKLSKTVKKVKNEDRQAELSTELQR